MSETTNTSLTGTCISQAPQDVPLQALVLASLAGLGTHHSIPAREARYSSARTDSILQRTLRRNERTLPRFPCPLKRPYAHGQYCEGGLNRSWVTNTLRSACSREHEGFKYIPRKLQLLGPSAGAQLALMPGTMPCCGVQRSWPFWVSHNLWPIRHELYQATILEQQ